MVARRTSIRSLLGGMLLQSELASGTAPDASVTSFVNDLLASVQGDVTTNLVQVYKSLGGGWQIRDQRDPVDLLPAATREAMKERTDAWENVLE